MNQRRNAVPIIYAGGNSGLGHMLIIRANISGEDVRLIFDTGIGVNLISKPLCSKLKCKMDGFVIGKRMTGQDIAIPMAKVASLQVAGQREQNVDVGVLDLESFLPNNGEFEGVQGYLSLGFFKDRPFTVDYKNGHLFFESKTSLKERIEESEEVQMSMKQEGHVLTVQVPVKTQIQKIFNMQLDLGTNIMTINSKFAGVFRPYFEKNTLKKEVITDETDFRRKRFFVKLSGQVGLQAENPIFQDEPMVMFQEIIYDGIIGNDFFKNRVITIDLPSSRLLIERM